MKHRKFEIAVCLQGTIKVMQ